MNQRNRNGQFAAGTSGNPKGRPRKEAGPLSFVLPLANNPDADALLSGITRLAVEAAAGKRPLGEVETMTRILRQCMTAHHEKEAHDIAVEAALIKGLQTMLDHIEKQSAVLESKNEATPSALRELIASAKTELENHHPPSS